MAWQSHQRNNLAAGAFLIIAMFAAVAVSIVLSGSPFKSTSTYRVRFDLAEGVPGIKAGSKVLVGGYQVGEVGGVHAELPNTGGPPTGILVTIVIASHITLYTDALITLERPLLGSLSEINIPDVGGRHGTLNIADDITEFDGMIAPPSILRDAGWGDDERTKLRKILDRLDSATSKADDVIANIDAAGINASIDNLEGGIADIRSIIADFRESVPGWRSKADTILDDASEFSAKMPPLADKIDRRVDDAGDMIETVELIVDENREGIRQIVENTEEATRSIKDEWIALGTETLTSARDGAERFNQIATNVDDFLEENDESIRRTFGNLRLASDQLKLTMLEIRAQPWRLLVKPDAKEFQAQVLYDAARSYAMAASDLRAASGALEAVSARTDGIDAQRLEAINTHLDQSFEKYKEAESELLERMIQERP